jgi:Spy/CpxP family protein refolding chaperone
MKNVILAFSAMLAFSTASFAQGAATEQAPPAPKEMKTAPGKGQKHEKGHTKGEKGKGAGTNLGLSAEQEPAFRAVNKAHQEAVRAVQMDKALASDAKTSKIAELKAKYEADVKGVMTEEQYTGWLAKRAKRDEPKSNKGMKGGKAKADKNAQPDAGQPK